MIIFSSTSMELQNLYTLNLIKQLNCPHTHGNTPWRCVMLCPKKNKLNLISATVLNNKNIAIGHGLNLISLRTFITQLNGGD